MLQIWLSDPQHWLTYARSTSVQGNRGCQRIGADGASHSFHMNESELAVSSCVPVLPLASPDDPTVSSNHDAMMSIPLGPHKHPRKLPVQYLIGIRRDDQLRQTGSSPFHGTTSPSLFNCHSQ